MKTFSVVTIFPELIEDYAKVALLGRAQKKKLLAIKAVDLRNFARGRHAKIDDSPFGGGPGMVMQVEPIFRAVQKLKTKNSKLKTRVVLFSTRGKVFDQKAAHRLARYDHLIFIAGRYEGVDERVARYLADEELSLGGFVLAGGELPALVVIEAVARHIPGVVGKRESLEEKKGSYPVYTRPATFTPKKSVQWNVPTVLQRGDHKKIAAWRRKHGR
ncbi:MAG: tRNA (guanosine(37)-N1)-methyltransferase TrmD [Candidatus Jorgensenbacteria bacterium]|nr:tRNA (guanosine(37)-N1)-methyltransferase TrmD [Candidatus Jorgensenbacteria bacterium]